MYIGSKDLKGLHHCAKEIISNSIDEYLNGAGNTIIIRLQKDGGLYIKDNGRGIPHGKHESGCSILQACYGIANTGGKFNNATGETGYNTSGGEHGTGGKAVNALSKKMIVTTAREGTKEIVEFSKGQFISYKTEPSKEQGVEVLFYPDDTVLETAQFDSEQLETMIKEFSFLCTGLTFVYEDEFKQKKETYYSEHGLEDYINYLAGSQKTLTPTIFFEQQEGTFKLEVALTYLNTYSSTTKLYTNNIPQEKGTHLTGFKTAFTSTINAYAREKGWLKEKDSNLTGSDLEEGQLLVLNFRMIDPVFKGQNKEELTSSEGRTYVQRLTTQALKEWLPWNEKVIKPVIDKALLARKAREAAKKARDAARGVKGKKESSIFLNLPTKLVDCWGKDRMKCELFVAEGDSAANGLVKARDAETQAVFPIRGKMISGMKNSEEKIFANQEIANLIKALGLDLDPRTKKLTYDTKKLRYGKIVAAADADPDGKAIKNLLFTDLWLICPELFLNGHVYAAMPPLFRITTKKNEYIYLEGQAELDEYKAKHQGEKYIISRNKGLGEQDDTELGPALLDHETRNLAQIIVHNQEEADRLFDVLMGPSVPPRRAFLLEHSEEAEDVI